MMDRRQEVELIISGLKSLRLNWKITKDLYDHFLYLLLLLMLSQNLNWSMFFTRCCMLMM